MSIAAGRGSAEWPFRGHGAKKRDIKDVTVGVEAERERFPT